MWKMFDTSLILTLIGPSKCGKSTFAAEFIKYLEALGISATHLAAADLNEEGLIDGFAEAASQYHVIIVEIASMTTFTNETKFADALKKKYCNIRHLSLFWRMDWKYSSARGSDKVGSHTYNLPDVEPMPWDFKLGVIGPDDCPLAILISQEDPNKKRSKILTNILDQIETKNLPEVEGIVADEDPTQGTELNPSVSAPNTTNTITTPSLSSADGEVDGVTTVESYLQRKLNEDEDFAAAYRQIAKEEGWSDPFHVEENPGQAAFNLYY